MSPTQNSN